MIATRVFGTLSGILAARLLGRAGRGELAVIVFMPMMLISLGELEFSRSLVVESGKSNKVSPQLISTAFWVALLLGLLEVCLLATVLRSFLSPDKLYLLASARLFALYLPATFITVALNGIDQGRGMFGRFSFFLVLPGALYLLAILFVIWPAHWIFPESFALASLVAVISAAVLRASQDWRAIATSGPNLNLAFGLLKRGFGFYIPTLAGLALLRADMFLLVRLAPAAAIGAYAVAQAISMGQVGVINPFVQVGFAAVAQQSGHSHALEALTRHFRLAQVAVVGIGVFVAGITPWAIRVFFGREFLSATTATYFLIGAAACWGLGETLEQGLRAASHPRLGIVSNLLGLALLIALGVPAYHKFGISGLAATVLMGQASSLLALILFCIFYLDMKPGSFWAFNSATVHELTEIIVPLLKPVRFVK
jgi:O-antigen/teichoic acid export membrane protein